MHHQKFILVIALLLSSFHGNAQETDPWTKYMMPGDIHKKLEQYIGNFEMEITMNMAEGVEPVIIKVYSVHKMILGGRFLEMTQSGDMMGMPYQSITTVGYNNSDKNYSLTTITNMGTGTLYLSGLQETGTQTVQLKGKLGNPINGQTIEIRQAVHFIDADNMLIENFDKESGSDEKKTVTYRFTRIK